MWRSVLSFWFVDFGMQTMVCPMLSLPLLKTLVDP
jgi:hypothetical protein